MSVSHRIWSAPDVPRFCQLWRNLIVLPPSAARIYGNASLPAAAPFSVNLPSSLCSARKICNIDGTGLRTFKNNVSQRQAASFTSIVPRPCASCHRRTSFSGSFRFNGYAMISRDTEATRMMLPARIIDLIIDLSLNEVLCNVPSAGAPRGATVPSNFLPR